MTEETDPTEGQFGTRSADAGRAAGSAVSGGNDGSPVVEVRGLKKVYDGETLAVDGIDFAIPSGNFCVIIGPSGCGKSTTLHSLIGKVEPTAGRVFIDGTDVTDTPTYERDIGLVFQDFQLFPHLTVEENVRYGLERLGRSDDEVVEETLALMNLTDSRDRLTPALSAGQRQRVALARSLVLRPKVLLLDEPLGDMDYKLQKRMEQELLRVHREVDTTFLYVTHDQRQAMRLADQLIVMNEGKIEQTARAEDVYEDPATAFVAAFVGDSNIFRGIFVPDGNAHVVETPFGNFHVAGDASGLDAGDDVSFVVRPHTVSVTAGEADRQDGITGDNRLLGEVIDVIEQPGSATQVYVEIPGDDGRREVHTKTWEDTGDLEAGTIATVSWATENARLLTETSVVPEIDLERDILGE